MICTRILSTDCHHIPRDLIVDCFSQPPSQWFLSFYLSAIYVSICAKEKSHIAQSWEYKYGWFKCQSSLWFVLGIHFVYFWGWSAPIQVTLCPIDSLISSILGYRAPVQLYNIVTIATRWKPFRIRTSFIGDLDPLERIGELWPLSGEDWLLLQLTRIGYNYVSSGDYDPRKGLGGYGPLPGEDWPLLQPWHPYLDRVSLQTWPVRLFFSGALCTQPFIPQTCLCVIFAVLGLGALIVLLCMYQ